jgi:hypothetical protein
MKQRKNEKMKKWKNERKIKKNGNYADWNCGLSLTLFLQSKNISKELMCGGKKCFTVTWLPCKYNLVTKVYWKILLSVTSTLRFIGLPV